MFTAPKGELSIPEANVDEVGDHCVAAVGIDSADRIMFRNSWGVAWGHNGYGFMPRGYYEKYAIETRLLRNARVGPHPGKSNRIRAADSPEEYAQAWMLENSRWRKRFRHGSKRLEWVVYETISVDGSLVEVLELRSAYGLRLAWAHVFHSKESDKPIVIVKEFFVWPAFRRRGFGRLLEWGVRDLAPKYGATCVRLLLHQCDYLDGRVVVGREFAACLGYNWCWATTPNQTLAAVAAKKL
jgi:GNAT superfamily N-acetyltransferase